jgi:hypothetical protein
MTTVHTNTEEYPEFDQFARSYAELLEDPMRKRFSRGPLHFHRRKALLIEKLLHRTGAASKTLRWLDVGCGRGELLELAQAGRDGTSALEDSTRRPVRVTEPGACIEQRCRDSFRLRTT